MSVKEILEALGGKDKYTTVMTVMSRLYDKKVLKREKQGHRYEYWLAKKDPLFKRLSSHLFGIGPQELVAHLIDEEEEIDLDAIEKMIKNARKKRNG